MTQLTFEASGADFETALRDSVLPVLIEFTADWCPPCKMLAPIVHELSASYEGKMRVGMLDSDANPHIVQQHGVMGLPTLILFVGGVAVERIVGFTPRERIEAKILPHLTVEKV